MRLALGLCVAVSLIASAAMAEEGGGSEEAKVKPWYTVFCRWIKQPDDFVAFPPLTLVEGEKCGVHDGSRRAFVTGATLETHPNAKGHALRPKIVVLFEGIKVELTVAGRQPNGASVDATIEQSTITRVDAKKCNQWATVQVPKVATQTKRVLDFVEFDSPLVVPLGEKNAAGISPRLEIIVCEGENAKLKKASHVATGPATSGDVERDAIFDAILATSDAKMRCERISRWERLRGHRLYDDLEPVQNICHAAESLSHCPHSFGILDVLTMLVPAVHDPIQIRAVEEAVFGCVPAYSISLRASPSLSEHLKLLRRLPCLWDVSIEVEHVDEQLTEMAAQLKVLHRLEIWHGNNSVML
jgi:hypothetical protein